MTTKPFHSSMRIAYSALLLSILAASGDVSAEPTTGGPDKKASDDGSIFKAVGDETVVRLKRILDADPNAWKARNGVKNQPLHLAAEAGNNGAVGLLLERGADVTARGNGGWTALHFAAEEGHPETCRILLKAGAKRGALCDFGLKAMDYAQDPETRLALQSDRILVPGVKDFLSAAGGGDLEKVQTMLRNTPDLLDATGSEGKTAVMEAAAHNRVELLKWLIEAGADIDLMTEEREVTALYLATENGQVETVRLLLDHEVEVNPAPTHESEQRATESPLSLATTFMVVSERGTRATSAAAAGDSEKENLNHSHPIARDFRRVTGGRSHSGSA